MKLGIRRTVAALATLLLATSAVVAISGTAQAQAYAWPNDPASVGDVHFFDATGAPVTGGDIAEPIAAYAQSTATLRANDTKATLFGALPVEGVAPGAWTSVALTASTTYPDATAPAALAASPLPLVKIGAGDDTLFNLADNLPHGDGTSATYQGLYALRLKTSFAGTGGTATATYATGVVRITGATWTLVEPAPVVTTSIGLAVSPASPAYHGSKVTLSATVTPAAPGSIQFKDGSTVIKTVTAVAGKASYAATGFGNGTHKFSVHFVPTDATSFTASTSATKSYVVRAHATKTALSVSKTTVKKGKPVTLKATVNVSSAVGSVKFYDGKKLLKTVTVKSGKASFTKSFATVGKHKLTAKFVPKRSADFTGSTSGSKTVKVTK